MKLTSLLFNNKNQQNLNKIVADMDDAILEAQEKERLKNLRHLLSYDPKYGARSKFVYKGAVENSLEQVPRELFLIKSLRVLDLSSDRMTHIFDYVPPDVCRLTKLKVLNLDLNRIRELPSDIGILEQLESLTLTNNKLRTLPSSLANLKQLQSLHLSTNRFIEFPMVVCQLKALKFLDLSSNRIENVPREIGNLAPTLETLLLYDNFIQSVPESLCLLVNLQTLWLGSNEIRKLPRDFYKLKKLDWNDDLMMSSCIGENPMEVPPMEICDKGFKEIVRYLENHNYP